MSVAIKILERLEIGAGHREARNCDRLATDGDSDVLREATSGRVEGFCSGCGQKESCQFDPNGISAKRRCLLPTRP
jgi:hypothetical protein